MPGGKPTRRQWADDCHADVEMETLRGKRAAMDGTLMFTRFWIKADSDWVRIMSTISYHMIIHFYGHMVVTGIGRNLP